MLVNMATWKKPPDEMRRLYRENRRYVRAALWLVTLKHEHSEARGNAQEE